MAIQKRQSFGSVRNFDNLFSRFLGSVTTSRIDERPSSEGPNVKRAA